jgi:hypothetical protein
MADFGFMSVGWILALAFALILIIGLVLIACGRKLAKIPENWVQVWGKTVPGPVVFTGPVGIVRATYYVFTAHDGREYQGMSHIRVHPHIPGGPVQVRYDPTQPQLSRISSGAHALGGLTLAGIIVASIGAVGALIGVILGFAL